MADYYNFRDHKKGDTYPKTKFNAAIDGVPLNITGASIKMMLRDRSKYVKKIFQNGEGITITNPAAGGFELDRQIIDIPAGEYTYDIQITLSDGSVKTYIYGAWTIKQDITYG
jgi:hypothetical protein